MYGVNISDKFYCTLELKLVGKIVPSNIGLNSNNLILSSIMFSNNKEINYKYISRKFIKQTRKTTYSNL